jgi:hypothetical protein
MFILITQKNNSNGRGLKLPCSASVCKTNHFIEARRKYYSMSKSTAPWSSSVSSMKVEDTRSISCSICGLGYVEKIILMNP